MSPGSWRAHRKDDTQRYKSADQLASQRSRYLVRAGGYFRSQDDHAGQEERAAKVSAIVILIVFAVSSVAYAADQQLDQDLRQVSEGSSSDKADREDHICQVERARKSARGEPEQI